MHMGWCRQGGSPVCLSWLPWSQALDSKEVGPWLRLLLQAVVRKSWQVRLDFVRFWWICFALDFFCPITRHVHVNQCFTAVPRKLQAQNMSQSEANLTTVPGVCVLETIDLWSLIYWVPFTFWLGLEIIKRQIGWYRRYRSQVLGLIKRHRSGVGGGLCHKV